MPPEPGTDTPTSGLMFEAYYDRIHRYVNSMVGDADEAEDLTQETFLRAHTEQQAVRDERAKVAWLYRIATNISLDRLRQRSRRQPHQAEVEPDELPPDPDAPSVQQTIEQGEMSACVQQYLADLPDTYRAVILLQDMHGLTGPQIAEALGLPLSTVKIRLHRARTRLKAALECGCAFSHDERNVLVCEPKP